MGATSQLFLGLLVGYVAYMAYLIGEMCYPRACRGKNCFHPLLKEGERVDMRLRVGDRDTNVWADVWNTTNVSADEILDIKVELAVPPEVRRGEQDRLTVEVWLSKHGDHKALARASVNVIKRMLPRARDEAMLLPDSLLSDAVKAEAPVVRSSDTGLAPPDYEGKVPHYIYARTRLEIRLVRDHTPHPSTHFVDGFPIGSGFDKTDGRRQYTPLFYADKFPLLSKHANPLSSDVTRAHPTLRIRFTPISIGWHRMISQISQALSILQAGTDALAGEDAFDEIKELLSEDRLYRFVIMQLIGLLHMLFDVLAFKNDVGFWKGREDLQGLSSRNVLFNAGCTLVIYLYLLDSPDINQIVLVSYTLTTAIDLWKVYKVLMLRRRIAARAVAAAAAAAAGGDGDSGAAGGVDAAAAAAAASNEARTETFDALATRTLGIGVAPLVAGWALYALVSYPHRSWYSWLVSSLADAIYLFGFVMMTPQLFINYKLKSVAHLPWRVLMYKAFNTFIDDAFALMVAMPTAHRVACLRDDAVFLVYLYQRWCYPTDKKRANEYGIAYERDESEPPAALPESELAALPEPAAAEEEDDEDGVAAPAAADVPEDDEDFTEIKSD